MIRSFIGKGFVIGVICLLMQVSIPVVSCGNEPGKTETSFEWRKGSIFFLCHVEVTADETKGDAQVGNAPPILVWSTEFGTVEITTPLRHKTLTGRTKGIVIYSAGPYGNDPFYIDRDAAVCIVTTY